MQLQQEIHDAGYHVDVDESARTLNKKVNIFSYFAAYGLIFLSSFSLFRPPGHLVNQERVFSLSSSLSLSLRYVRRSLPSTISS